MSSVRAGGMVPLTDEYAVYLYKRVSDEDQDVDGRSLPTQERNGLAVVAREGWALRGIYEDVQSGRRNDRPDYQRMLREIRADALDGRRRPVVLLGTLDRLGRNARERLRCWDEIEALGGRIYAADHGFYDWLTYALLSTLAQEESRRIGHRVRTSIADMWAVGWHPPGRVRWGYRWRDASADELREDAPKRVLERHPTEAPYVEEAWRRLADGESLRKVAAWVHALPSSARGGRNLEFGVLRLLFRAPVYIGRPHSSRDPKNPKRDDLDGVLERPRGRWPALVSDRTWLAVRRNVDREKRTLPAQASGAYLLTGLLKCDRCGSRMGGRPKGTKANGELRRVYVCKGASLGASGVDACRFRAVPAEPVERAVLVTVTELIDLATHPNVVAAARVAWEEIRREQAADPGVATLADLERDLSTTRRRMHKNHQLYLDGDVDKVSYLNSQTIYQDDVKRIEEEMARLRGRSRPLSPPPLHATLAQIGGWRPAFDGDWRSRPERVRGVLAELFTAITPVPTASARYWEARFERTEIGHLLLKTVAAHGEHARPGAPVVSLNLGHVERFGLTKLSTCPA